MKLRDIITPLLVLACAACTNDMDTMQPQQTGFYLTLGDDAAVQTRMTPAELGAPVEEQFNVCIANNKTGRVVYDGNYTAYVKAGNGDYTLTASYGEDVQLAINSPYYYGEASASITAAEPNPAVTIPCKVANSLVSVHYLDKDGHESTSHFDNNFSQYAVRVELENRSIELFAAHQSAYFRAGQLPKFTFVGKLADTGEEVSYEIPAASLPASALSAADHLVLSLSLQVSPSGIVVNVSKAEVTQVTLQETLPLEWLPRPRVSAFGGDGELNYIETTQPSDEATIHISTFHALQDMEWQFAFADEPLASALNGTYRLSTLTAEQRTRLAGYGLELPEIGTQYADYCLDLRGIVSHLLTHNGTTVENSVSLRVKANDRWSHDEGLQPFAVNAVRPLFRMAEQQPGLIWAHSIYVTPISSADVLDAKGADPQQLASMAVYDISADGGQTWQEVTGQQEGYHHVDGLQAGTAYLLRARIGSVMTSAANATAITEAEAEVPNGDFEDLTTTYNNQTINQGGEYRRTLIGSTYGQNTQTFTVKEPTGWGSSNTQTCNLSASTVNSWFCPLSVYNTTIQFQTNEARISGMGGNTISPDIYCKQASQHGSNAMVVRNVAYSYNGTVPSRYSNTAATPGNNYYSKNTPNISNTAAGKLYLGSLDGGTAFGTRPTVLSGYYKYDTSKGSASDRATVTVALLNGSTVIATGSASLSAAGGYTAFNVPITYSNHTTKATALRIVISSAENESGIATTKVAEYIQEAYGSVLCIDNLTFTYGK